MQPWTMKPAAEFTFAGFTFPKFVWTLPTAPMSERLKHAKNRVVGPDYHAPTPNSKKGQGFDLAAGENILRWEWCDHVEDASIQHTGWFIEPELGNDKIRGLVFRLPRGRGFLIGWSMGLGMASVIETDYIYGDEYSAAMGADELAESAAEEEREYQEKQREAEEKTFKLPVVISIKARDADEAESKLCGLGDEHDFQVEIDSTEIDDDA